MHYDDRKRTALFWLAISISASLFMPTLAYAQMCKGKIGRGCLNPGAVCSPPDFGGGSSGHCTATIGEKECQCVGRATEVLKAFDVVSSFWDANNFPLNPMWSGQAGGVLPNPVYSCPPDSTTTSDWTSSPTCTTYPVTFNGASGFICGHHTNFMPVTYEGTAQWDGGPSFFPFGDEDYTFNLTRDDAALYSTAGNKVHVEFDATETVNNWDGTGTWWENFHHNGVDKGDDKAATMINGHYVMVVGRLGMDEYSGIGHSQGSKGHTELHPAYAVFVLVNQDPRTRKSTWAFFVRNWGNEGYCGPDQVPTQTTIRIQIPPVAGRLALVSQNVWEGARNTDDLTGLGATGQPNAGGMLLSFSLLAADQQSWFMGDLTFQETLVARPSANTLARLSVKTRARPSVESEEMHGTVRVEDGVPPEFRALLPQFDKLSKSAQQRLREEEQSVFPKKGGKRASLAIVTEPTQLGNRSSGPTVVGAGDLVSSSKDSAGELSRSKQLEILKKYFAK